ncbi:Uncharacterised protein [Actinobacillus delphinicola]|uniref:Uncharacterized protein n=1 Tax=Actinobacillus delphinicola TaxID=51161 RepID=A0A448TS56_9PAST|nr:Uncharacterised protein [Actinobacillus delphinicola]
MNQAFAYSLIITILSLAVVVFLSASIFYQG